ncbi:MAG: hypothetical protein LBI42_07965 [Chitinispirillales bacterium]|jgi:methyl-accepting chemotaxis protein|nr:hypothetical protein [Chitinispirillales bacterium]
MAEKFVRKPLGNFFIKKALQLRLIMRVAAVAVISSVVSSGVLLLVYYLRYETVVVYQWNQVNNELMRENIINLLLPTLIISSFAGLVVALGIGFYASRKYAVPIYKMEHWAASLLKGKMTTVLKFREHEEMKELSQKCNELSSSFRTTLLAIKKKVDVLQNKYPQDPDVESIEALLSKMELSADEKPVETING